MLRVIIDADLVLDFLLKRVGYLVNAEQVWEMIESQTIRAYITKHGSDKIYQYICTWRDMETAEEVTSDIEKIIQICFLNASIVEKARLSNITDFESAVEVICAVENQLDGIVTQRPQNFTGATLAIYSVDSLLKLRRVKLSQWFFHPFEVFNSSDVDWQSVEPTYRKNPIGKISDQPENSVSRVKIIRLKEQQAEQKVQLVVQVRQKIDNEVVVLLLIKPAGESIYLPLGLQLKVLDESGATLEMAEAGSADNSIQIDLIACPEENFSIKFTLDDAYIIEHFTI